MEQTEKILFVGREDELKQMMAFAKEAFTGKPHVIFVTGEAGIGKTFLIEEFFRLLRKDVEDVVIATGQCTIESASYLPFQSILEDLLESKKHVKVTGKKLRQVMEVVVDTIWEVGPNMIGAFGIPIKALQTLVDKLELRGKKSFSDSTVPSDLNQVKVFGWYTKIMKDISTQFPLVLFIDDLHWSDDSSLNLLLHFGRELENQRILVIGAYRPHEIAPNSLLAQIRTKLSRYGAKQFSLDALEDNQQNSEKAQKFVHDYLMGKYGTNFSEQFEELLADRTEGNALFITEILKNMEEKRHIFRDTFTSSQPWFLSAQIEQLENLPEKIESVLSERINRLEHSLRDILDFASVEGDEFTAQVLAKVKQLEEWSLIEDLTQKLMNIHQLIKEGKYKSLSNGASVDEFIFRHNLIREYVYAQLPHSKKRRIHAKIGECLEQLYAPNMDEIASQLAIHFYYAHIPEKATLYCIKAASEANKGHGVSEAIRFSKMGIESLEQQKDTSCQEENKIKFLLELAKAEELGGDPQEKKDHIQAGILYLEENLKLWENTIPDILHAEVYLQLGRLYQRKGGIEIENSKKYLEGALNIYKQHNDKKNIAEILYELSDIYRIIPIPEKEESPVEKSIKTLKQSLSIAEQIGDIELQTICLRSLSWKYIYDNFEDAEKYALQALALTNNYKTTDKYVKIPALRAIARVYRDYTKLKLGIQHLEEALDLSRLVGDILTEADILNDLGFLYGDSVNSQEKAYNVLKSSLLIRERVGFSKHSVYYNLGRALGRRGCWEKAEESFKEAIRQSSERSQAVYKTDLGVLYMIKGEYEQAQEEFCYRLKVFEAHKISQDLLGNTKIALNSLLSGDNISGEKYLETAQTLLKTETHPRIKWQSLYEIAEIYRILKKTELAKTTCQRAIEWYTKNSDTPENLIFLAEARLVMGKILVDLGKYQEAITCLDKAKDAFKTCQHHAFGENLLYAGKAYNGLSNRQQAKEYTIQAINEFQRLELSHKECEATEVLETLS